MLIWKNPDIVPKRVKKYSKKKKRKKLVCMVTQRYTAKIFPS